MPQTTFTLAGTPSVVWTFENRWSIMSSFGYSNKTVAMIIPARIVYGPAEKYVNYQINNHDNPDVTKFDLTDDALVGLLASVARRPMEPGYADMVGTADDFLTKVMADMKAKKG
jgi:hypothetical protein